MNDTEVGAIMRKLYPAIEPYATHRVAVDGTHTLYVEECGNRAGIPVVFLHGGPGAGLSPYHRRFFNPEHYRIVLFDQRGAGRSTPFAELADNTTWHLVADMETLRERLEIERWVVFGGSWGSTLALAYAETHPERVLGLVLRGVFLARREEVAWLYGGGGASWVRPEGWRRFVEAIPEAERGDLLGAYWARLTSPDPAVRVAAAQAWAGWESSTLTLEDSAQTVAEFTQPEVAVSLARLEAHYFRHDSWLEPDQLLANAGRLGRIRTLIVQGRYDTICPPRSAVELARALPGADLRIVVAGHAASEPAIVDALIEAIDRFADRYR